jgi:hypothetical protein
MTPHKFHVSVERIDNNFHITRNETHNLVSFYIETTIVSN